MFIIQKASSCFGESVIFSLFEFKLLIWPSGLVVEAKRQKKDTRIISGFYVKVSETDMASVFSSH